MQIRGSKFFWQKERIEVEQKKKEEDQRSNNSEGWRLPKRKKLWKMTASRDGGSSLSRSTLASLNLLLEGR